MENSTQIVVLAAGKGKRMESGALPKVLIPLKGKPIIEYLLEELKKLPNVPPPVIVVGYKHSLVKKVLGNHYVYALQKQQLGTGHAVWSSRPRITAENIIVLYGDMPFIKVRSLQRLIELHHAKNSEVTIFTCTVPSFEGLYSSLNDYGRIIRDKSHKIVRIKEYKDSTSEERRILEVNPGIYMFKTTWLWNNIDKFKNNNAQGEYYLTDAVEIAISEGKQVHSIAVEPEEVYGINSKPHLQEAERFI